MEEEVIIICLGNTCQCSRNTGELMKKSMVDRYVQPKKIPAKMQLEKH